MAPSSLGSTGQNANRHGPYHHGGFLSRILKGNRPFGADDSGRKAAEIRGRETRGAGERGKRQKTGEQRTDDGRTNREPCAPHGKDPSEMALGFHPSTIGPIYGARPQ